MEKELEDGKTRWDRIVRLERATSGLCFYSGTLFLQRDFVSTMGLCLGGYKARWYGSFKADNGNIKKEGRTYGARKWNGKIQQPFVTISTMVSCVGRVIRAAEK